MLPLVLSIAGALAKDNPLDPASWRKLHEKLQDKREKFRDMEHGRLFATIDTSIIDLPLSQKKQFQLMSVMAPGVSANSEMLSNLWNQVRYTTRTCVPFGPLFSFCPRAWLVAFEVTGAVLSH